MTSPSPSLDVLVFGSANLDVVVRTARIPQPGETVLGKSVHQFAGGKGLNQAVAAARSGANTGFAAALGDDDAGRMLIDLIRAEGIADHLVAGVSGATGHAFITVDDAAENSIVVVPGANGHLSAVEPTDATVVLAQLETPLASVTATLRAAKSSGCTTVLNPAPATELPPELLEACDVLIPNEHELELLGGADRLLRGGDLVLVVTRGAQGAEVHANGDIASIPPFRVTPVDTTGAGDAFCGGLAARLAAGDSIEQATRWAAAAGALATTQPGAVPAQPSAEAVRALLAGSS